MKLSCLPRCGPFLLGSMVAMAAHAQPASAALQQQNIVSLTANATVELNKDWFSVVLSTTREGGDAAAVQGQLRNALDAALAEARKIAQPGQVELQTGSFSLQPRYAAPSASRAAAAAGPVIAGWTGSTELIVQGRDTQAIAALVGRIQTLQIARLGFSLSREAREKIEADVVAQAIQRFRQQADAAARQFGFSGYTVREVTVSGNEAPQMAVPMLRMQASRVTAGDEALPVEAGKASVTATVSGSVQMK